MVLTAIGMYTKMCLHNSFIPSRDGTDLQAAFQLLPEETLMPSGRHKRKKMPELDAQMGTYFEGNFSHMHRRGQ